MRFNTYHQSNGAGKRVAIVRARFNEDITQGLLDGARRTLLEAGVREEDIFLTEVPGSFEIPVAAARALDLLHPDAIVTLGCIIKGDTAHDDYLARCIFQSLQTLAVDSRVPITIGILTVLNREQAVVRSGDSEMNRGVESARAALEMMETFK